MISGIDHVQVAAPCDCEEAPVLAARGGVWFAVGAQQLHIGVEEPFAPAAKAHPAFRLGSAEELDVLAHRLEAAGIDLHWDDNLPGVRRFYTADPFGNRLELLAGR